MAHESFEDPATARAHERAVREHQGRSRGAARPRPHLPARAPDADAARRRLAADDVPDAATTSGRSSAARIFRRSRATACRRSRDLLQRVVASTIAAHRDGIAHAERRRCIEAFGEISPPAGQPARALDRASRSRQRAHAARTTSSTAHSAASAARRNFRTRRTSNCLLRALARDGRRSDEPDLQALYMATLTLTRMAEGGIYDQLGGGFCRYSVDQYWMIPHFEKMLYDNGQLLARLRAGGARDRRAAVPCASPARLRTGCARDAERPAAASTRRSTRTRKATKAGSTSGTAKEVRGLLAAGRVRRRSRGASGSTGRRTSKASGICTAFSP